MTCARELCRGLIFIESVHERLFRAVRDLKFPESGINGRFLFNLQDVICGDIIEVGSRLPKAVISPSAVVARLLHRSWFLPGSYPSGSIFQKTSSSIPS
jgi:hypothetical protein